MKQSFPLLAFLFCCIACGTSQTDQPPDSQPPNIVIILADDLGWADVGYNGQQFYETPNIDRLAGEGMVFNRFYPSAANCAPTRASLLTGMYSPRHGVYLPQGLARGGATEKMRFKVPTQGEDSTFWTFPVSINTVEPEAVSLAEMLKPAGYVSARLGKWHIGDDNQGFDVISSAGKIGEVFNKNGTERRFYSDTTVAENLTDAALAFMEQNREQPFFLYLSHWEVHTPLAAKAGRIAYYQEKMANLPDTTYDPTYAAEVEVIDQSVGRVMQKLEELDLADNTLVVFTSDNGGVSGITDNAPLRAGKGTFYEGGIRTPMCLRWPAKVAPGSEVDVPVNGVDFMPTFAEVAGAALPQRQPVDGLSILPLLEGEGLSERQMYFHFPLYLGGNTQTAAVDAYDGTPNYWRAVPSTTLIEGDWKLIYSYEHERMELYNLRQDVGETRDLSELEPEKAAQMLLKIRDWVEGVNAPAPQVPNEG